MRLLAISDLHLRHAANREALSRMPEHPDDWLIVAGDVGEGEEQMRQAWSILSRRFARLLWVPGNHDLWTPPTKAGGPRGEALYRRLVEVCREYGVLTPEDPWVRWPGDGDGGGATLALLFTLYDYSFRPDDVPAERAVDWAIESGVLCVDESLLHPDPHPSRAAWCAERCRLSEQRLAAVGGPTVLVNHWPLAEELLTVRRVPRFSIWCGTRRTAGWHRRFDAVAMVYGHFHVRRRVLLDGVRCDEVSLGYPRDWNPERPIESYLRQVLPAPPGWEEGFLE